MQGKRAEPGEDGEERRALFLRRLKEALCSLDGGSPDPDNRKGGIPPGFGWIESEAEYQQAQSAWLRGKHQTEGPAEQDASSKTGGSSGYAPD